MTDPYVRTLAIAWCKSDIGPDMCSCAAEGYVCATRETHATAALAALRDLGWTPPTTLTLCGCMRCTEARWPLFTDTPPGPATPGWRYACEFCGDKRCPHHQWHGAACPATDAQHADTDGTAALHDPLRLAALYDRVEAVEALLLAVVPAGYVDGKAVEVLRERVVELAGVARV